LPCKIILEKVLNNVKYDYTNFKNYNPVLKSGQSVYYYMIKNKYDHATKKTSITMDLYRYFLDRQSDERVNRSASEYDGK